MAKTTEVKTFLRSALDTELEQIAQFREQYPTNDLPFDLFDDLTERAVMHFHPGAFSASWAAFMDFSKVYWNEVNEVLTERGLGLTV